jgi:hypothetical protein
MMFRIRWVPDFGTLFRKTGSVNGRCSNRLFKSFRLSGLATILGMAVCSAPQKNVPA